MKVMSVWCSCIVSGFLLFSWMQPRSLSGQAISMRYSPTSSGHVTVIILDMSGSMHGNDQSAVRCSAAEAFIDLSGAGDQVGIVSLSSAGPMVWHVPAPTDVISERSALKQAIEQRPAGTPNCQNPFGDTPTYDALVQAFQMLEGATQSGKISGSVILLSDGVPTPDTSQQVNRIQNEVIPQFERNHWAIDTVALGTGETLRPFLKEIAQDTGGIPYDDAQGAVPGQASALNITPFFINIFSQRVGHTLNQLTGLSALNHGTHPYDFDLPNYAKTLDIIVVKDEVIRATLESPPPRPIILPSDPPPPHTFVSKNSFYEVFTVEGPTAGNWQLTINGSGRYQVSSLVDSWLQVSFSNPQQNGALLDLDHPFPLVTTIVDVRNPYQLLSLQGLNFDGTITYNGTPPEDTVPYAALYHLDYDAHRGFYQTTIHFPSNAAPGTYTLVVYAVGKTSAVIAANTLTIRMEKFPVLSPSSLPTTQVQWPEWLQIVYGPSDPILHWLSPFLLHDTTSEVPDSIQKMGATSVNVIQASLLTKNQSSRSLIFSNKAHEQFQLQLPALPGGTYAVNILLAGSFDKFTGKLPLGTEQLTILVKAEEPTFVMYLLPIGIIVAFLALLFFLLYLIITSIIRVYLYVTGPAPYGTCTRHGQPDAYYFNQARRSLISLFVRRFVNSKNVHSQMPPGLIFRFDHHRSIKVRKRRFKKSNWQGTSKKNRKLSHWFYREFDQLTYEVKVGPATTYSTYSVEP